MVRKSKWQHNVIAATPRTPAARSQILNQQSMTSSNVVAFSYNKTLEALQIEFHNGSVYEYQPVTYDTFKQIYQGKALPVTSGQNQWHRWVEGQGPSVGAAVWKYLRNAGVPYTRVSNLSQMTPANYDYSDVAETPMYAVDSYRTEAESPTKEDKKAKFGWAGRYKKPRGHN